MPHHKALMWAGLGALVALSLNNTIASLLNPLLSAVKGSYQ